MNAPAPAWTPARRALVLAVLLGAVPSRASEPGSPERTPGEPSGRAAAARRTGEHEELARARQRYEQAWQHERSFAVASDLGALELALDDPAPAAQHLSYALTHFPVDGSAELRGSLEHRLAEAAKRVGQVRLTVEPAGARVLLDGAFVGRAPLAGPLYAPPGPHRIEAELDRASTSAQVRLDPGGTRALALSLDGEAAPDTTAGALRTGPSTALVATGIGLTVAGAAAGVALAVMASGRDALAAERGDALEALALPEPCAQYPAGCEDIRADQQARDGLTVGAGVAFGVAGAAGVATLVYALATGSEEGGEPASVSLQPAPQGEGARIGLSARW